MEKSQISWRFLDLAHRASPFGLAPSGFARNDKKDSSAADTKAGIHKNKIYNDFVCRVKLQFDPTNCHLFYSIAIFKYNLFVIHSTRNNKKILILYK